MESSGDQVAKVRTVDGAEFDVPIKVLNVCGYFKDFLDGSDSVAEVLDIAPFSIVNKDMMEAIIEFSSIVINNKPPQISKPIFQKSIYEVTSPPYAAFADKFEDDRLCQLILAADKLNNQDLLELLSAKLAIHLNDKSTEEIRKYFNIITPFEKEADEQRVKDENEEAKEIYNLNDDDD